MPRHNGSERLQIIIGYWAFTINTLFCRLLAKWKRFAADPSIAMVRIVIIPGLESSHRSVSRYPHFPRQGIRRSRYRQQYQFQTQWARNIGNGHGYMVYAEVTGRLAGLLNAVRQMYDSSIQLLCRPPDFLFFRLGRNYAYPYARSSLADKNVRQLLIDGERH
eukprot:11903423-Karenia_brevis.AAC.1